MTAPGVTFRAMLPHDVRLVADLEAATFSTPWSLETFASLVGADGVDVWVGETEDRQLVAYAVARYAGDYGELANLAVRPDFRRLGVGSALLDHVLGVARERGVAEMFLEVRASNEQAVRMYQDRGFRRIGVRRGYYRSPKEDAWVFLCTLA